MDAYIHLLVSLCGSIFFLSQFLALISDLSRMTIPNRLCVVTASMYLPAAIAAGSAPSAIALHLAIGLFVLAITFTLFALNWMGGGDAKLITATALWFGPSVDLANYILLSSVFGGVLTLLILAARAVRQPTTGVVFLDRLLAPTSGIPYGVALGLAGIWVFWTGQWGQTLL